MTGWLKGGGMVMRKILIWILVFVLLPLSALADLQVYFLDVGQGDCAVILCDGETMIIDGGPYGASGKVYSYVRKTLNLRHVDYLVSTHPHVDHVYGLSTVLNAAQVDLVLSPVLVPILALIPVLALILVPILVLDLIPVLTLVLIPAQILNLIPALNLGRLPPL
jgi:glyoxylase-like metal-dependent hydrolase (beta-lactamase superfamily II)